MLAQAVNAAVGVLVGILCGFFFERRSTRDARRRNSELEGELADLEAELSVLRHSVLTMGAPSISAPGPVAEDGLADAVRLRALATQNSEGRVHRSALRTYFIGEGHQRGAIDEALASLCAEGYASEEGEWLALK